VNFRIFCTDTDSDQPEETSVEGQPPAVLGKIGLRLTYRPAAEELQVATVSSSFRKIYNILMGNFECKISPFFSRSLVNPV
jgi:hypothetical protein